jgi:hypothetical protein
MGASVETAVSPGWAPGTWSIVIFSSRETPPVLLSTIEAAAIAAGRRQTTIDVMVNGGSKLADKVAESVGAREPAKNLIIRVWHLALTDKAHAWNRYVQDIWPGSDFAFFVDGYAHVKPDALALIAEGMAAFPKALAGSGVPSVGRSAKAQRERMLREGGAHGNLYTLRGETMARLRASGFHLPLGLYYTDPLLQSALCFDLDPSRNSWDWGRIFVHPAATWTFRPLDWRRPADLLAHSRRLVRQAQAKLERMAYGYHFAVQRAAPGTLPLTTAEMVAAWRTACPSQARRTILLDPLLLLGLRRLRKISEGLTVTSPPRLVTQSPPADAQRSPS